MNKLIQTDSLLWTKELLRRIKKERNNMQLNNHNEIMQEVLYKGKTIKFKVKQFPATPQHLTMIAENYFSTGKEVRDMEI